MNYNIIHRLVTMAIKEMVSIANISIEEAFQLFYKSETIKYLEDDETLYFTYSPTALAYVCLEEYGKNNLN